MIFVRRKLENCFRWLRLWEGGEEVRRGNDWRGKEEEWWKFFGVWIGSLNFFWMIMRF